MMRKPPTIAAKDSGSPVRNQSTMTTRKIVRLIYVSILNSEAGGGGRNPYRAATEESTGEVSEMSTRKDPENVAFARTLINKSQPASALGS